LEEARNAYKILVGIPLRKHSLGRPRIRWLNNIRALNRCVIQEIRYLIISLVSFEINLAKSGA
jgi:hypothetical protein